MSAILFAARRHSNVQQIPAGGGGGSPLRYFRPSTVNAELPRGISSNYDLLFDEATQTLSTVGGAGYAYLWPWDQQRVGSSRHAAVTVRNCSTYAEVLTAVADFANIVSVGDWEIRVPATLTMTGMLTIPYDTDMSSRQLYFTYNGTLPTADVMPSAVTASNHSVWTGASTGNAAMIAIYSKNCPAVTLTGIVLRPAAQIDVGVIDIRFNDGGTLTAQTDAPKRLVVDRCWIDAQFNTNTRRGIAVNGWQVAILESWVTDIQYPGSECGGIGGWTNCQQIVLRNVFVEASMICCLYGGADPLLPNTNTCDPMDILELNVCASKKLEWILADVGIKNGYEAKNVRRRLILNSITNRHYATAQTHAMLFQNVSDQNLNLEQNRIEDVVVHNHEFVDCQNGLNLHAGLAAHIGFANGTQSGNVIRADYGYLTWINTDGYYVGKTVSVEIGTGAGQTAIVTGYVAATKTFSLDRSWTTVDTSSRLRIDSPQPTQISDRCAFVNVRLRGLGRYVYGGGFNGNPFRVLDSFGKLLIDQWTWVMYDDTKDDILRFAQVPSDKGTEWWFTNMAGRALGLFGDGGVIGFNVFSNGVTTAHWAGNSFYGPFQYGGTHTPGLTQYALGGTLAADAAAMGFDLSTGVISGAGADDGVGGGMPGVNHTQLNAALSSMQTWAFSR